jgi:putative oxidoreductase
MRFGLLLLRLITGAIFAVHGYSKLFGGPEVPVHPAAARYLGPNFVSAMRSGHRGFTEMLRTIDVPVPAMMALIVGVVEFLGGTFLALGVLTRFSALLLSADMAVAIWKVHWKNGLVGAGGFEFALMMLASGLTFLFGGRGGGDRKPRWTMKAPSVELPKMDLSKMDLPKVEVPKMAFTNARPIRELKKRVRFPSVGLPAAAEESII